MKRFLGLLTLTAMLAGACPVTAAEQAVDSRIDKVTVFRSSAEIARTFQASVAPGSHVLVLSDLPAGIEENSLHVDGEAGQGVEVTSVDSRRILVPKPGAAALGDSERARIEAEIQRLADERTVLGGAIAAAEAQKALAENLARLPLNGAAREVQGAPPADWNAMFDLIGDRLAASARSAQEARVKQRGLTERIDLLHDQLRREPPEASERTELRIHVEASAPATISMRLRYHVSKAGWEPIYDARLTTGGKDGAASLTIARRASIAQETGEDWTDAALTLSTVRPDAATAAPALAAMKLAFRPEPRPSVSSSDGASPRLAAPAAEPAPVEERKAVVEDGPYQAAFVTPQAVTVKSGVGAKRVLIASEEIVPALFVLAVPKADAMAYLHARFTFEGIAPLLPGPVTLYRDGAYIGDSALPLIVRGEEVELGFGPDDAVKVARVELKRAKGESGIISSAATDEQHFRISVKNLHDWAMPVTVVDQIPVSENEQIAVDMLPMTTEPSERNYGDKLGLLAWSFEMQPQEEQDILLSYEIKWPAKRELTVSEY